MLRELLKLMAEKGLLTIGEAGSELGASRELIELALEQLKALGLVKEAWSACPTRRTGCVLGRCPLRRLGRAFYLTDDGLRLAKKGHDMARTGPVIVRPKKKEA